MKPIFRIDRDKCKKDGLCAKACPGQLILMKENEFPVPIENAGEFCINCGHCVAVCPHDALSLTTMAAGDCLPFMREILPARDAMQQLLKGRRSVRAYKDKRVPRKVLEEIVDVGSHAPTGSNKQQVHWMVFEDRAEVNLLSGMVIEFMKSMMPLLDDEALLKRTRRIAAAWDNGQDRIMRGAPHLVLVHSQADLPYAQVDCTIALTYMELYAYSIGLGTCWAGYFTTASNLHAPLMAHLNLPAGHQCFGAAMVGYPQYRYRRIPQRNRPDVTWRPGNLKTGAEK